MNTPKNWTAPHPGVFRIAGGAVTVGQAELQFLHEQLPATPRQRARLCGHPTDEAAVHEMIIALAHGAYIRPHRHPGKSESYHVIEGVLTIVLFTDRGEVTEVISLAPHGSGKPFFYRLAAPVFHTVLVDSPRVSFHETTSGPFRRADTVFADWAPAEDASDAIRLFQQRLCRETADMKETV